jgi:hypothetical protein
MRPMEWEQAWLSVRRERAALSQALSGLRVLERQTQRRGPSPDQATELRRLRSLVSAGHTALSAARVVLSRATALGGQGSAA